MRVGIGMVEKRRGWGIGWRDREGRRVDDGRGLVLIFLKRKEAWWREGESIEGFCFLVLYRKAERRRARRV